jgi:hypothetical protein
MENNFKKSTLKINFSHKNLFNYASIECNNYRGIIFLSFNRKLVELNI